MRTRELFNLKGKVGLVTGAGRGLGRVFSQTLAEAGANVVCVDYASDPLEETVKLLETLGHKVFPIIADVSKPEDVEQMTSDIVSQFGRLDIAVNNAGIITKPHRFHEMPLEDWGRLIAIDLTGVFMCMQEELRVMARQRSGIIINIASVAGLRGVELELMPPRANYIAAKHGVIGLTKQAALEYAQDNIRVNAIAPGWFSGTSLSHERTAGKSAADIDLEQKRIKSIPLKRAGSPDELAGLLLYLASDASSYVTGQVFVADGGMTAY